MKKNNKRNLSQNYQRNLIMATITSNIGINNHDRLVKAYGANANRIELLNKLHKQSKFTLIWYITFVVLGLTCLALDPSSWLNVLDLFIVMVNIDLVSRGKLSGIYIGILECFVYSYIAYQSALYGEIVKNLCIAVPLNTFSIISWTISMKKQAKEKFIDSQPQNEIIIRKLSKKQKAMFAGIFVVVFALCYSLLRFVLHQKNALILGAITLSMSIIGKILTARRYMEAYLIFNTNDVISLLMWGQTLLETGFSISTFSMIVYALAMFTMDVYAYGLWKSMYRKVAVNGGVLLAMRKVNIKRIVKLRRRFRNLKWDKEVDMSKNS